MKWYDFFGDDMNKYPFQITDDILNKVAEISQLVGQVSVSSSLSSNPTLRRTNRINTIYSSLAIEQNTLSIDQVTAVIFFNNGKREFNTHTDSGSAFKVTIDKTGNEISLVEIQ